MCALVSFALARLPDYSVSNGWATFFPSACAVCLQMYNLRAYVSGIQNTVCMRKCKSSFSRTAGCLAGRDQC